MVPPAAFLLLLPLFLLPATSSQDADETRTLTRQELDTIRQRILRSLGLSKEPDMSQLNVTDEEKSEAYQLYLQQVREMETQKRREDDHNDDDNDNESKDDDTDAEIIYTFKATGEPASTYLKAKNGSSTIFPVRMRIPIDIPEGRSRGDKSSEKSPRAASIRFYKSQLESSSAIASKWRPRAHPPLATFFVYQVSPNHMSQRMLLATQRVVARNGEWEAMDVSSIVGTLPGNSTSVSGLVVLDLDCDQCESLGLRVSLSGRDVPNTNDVHTGGNENSVDHSPALDLFVGPATGEPTRSKRSAPRHSKPKKNKKKEKPVTSLAMYERSWNGLTDCTKGTRGKCCRHRMYVDFNKLKMNYVVEPKGFEAYYCKGKCPRLYNPAHTHALIQSTMHAIDKVPKPCCAPSKLSNLTIMHYDENGKLKVTNWTSAVVEECACS